jgi:ribosomal protein S14
MARRSAAYGAAPRQAKTVKQLLIKRCRQCGRGAGCRKIFLAFRQGEVFFT